jgi:hypothetical protein
MSYSKSNQTKLREFPNTYTQPAEPVAPDPTTFTLDPEQVTVYILPYTLTGGAPSGGTYSGAGVSGGTFSPLVAGIGAHVITYTANGDAATDTLTVTIGGIIPNHLGVTFWPGVANEIPPDTTENGWPGVAVGLWTIAATGDPGYAFAEYAAYRETSMSLTMIVCSGPSPVDTSSPTPNMLVFCRSVSDPTDFASLMLDLITITGAASPIYYNWSDAGQQWELQ